MTRFADCFFEPWVGSNFGDGLLDRRVLLLGESHYGDYIAPNPRVFTADVVRRYAVDGPTIPYFTIVYRVVTGEPIPSPATRSAFWSTVAFYNYVQCYVGTGPRQRPSPSDWASGRVAFERVLAALKPNCVVVLGRELLWNIQQQHALAQTAITDVFRYSADSDQAIVLGAIRHPTSGFAYARWRPTIEAMLAASVPPRRGV